MYIYRYVIFGGYIPFHSHETVMLVTSNQAGHGVSPWFLRGAPRSMLYIYPTLLKVLSKTLADVPTLRPGLRAGGPAAGGIEPWRFPKMGHPQIIQVIRPF